MAQTLARDCTSISQRGAGYYSTTPFVNKYNKLLEQAQALFGNESTLLNSFDEIEDTKSTDPSMKEKTTQAVQIEVDQLIAFIEAVIQQQTDTAESASGTQS